MHPTSAPTVSVVIPAYNVERFIAGAIRCVLDQTYTDFELIVVDDGGSDGSAAIAQSFDDPRLRLIRQRNRGLAGARNAGIRAARGRFIAFLDADDLWHPLKLACHVAHLRARPEVGVSYSASAFIDDAGRPMHLLQSPKLHQVTAADVFLRNPVGNGSAPVIRAETLAAIAFDAPTGTPGERWYFDERFRQSEDIECWVRMALTTRWRFEGLADALTLYRVNAGGLSAQLDRQLASWERMVLSAAAHDRQFVQRWAGAARGYQLRYLARRAVRLGDARRALQLLWAGLRSHPSMLVEEPARTLLTAAAALVRTALTARGYSVVEALGMRAAACLQRGRAAA